MNAKYGDFIHIICKNKKLVNFSPLSFSHSLEPLANKIFWLRLPFGSDRIYYGILRNGILSAENSQQSQLRSCKHTVLKKKIKGSRAFKNRVKGTTLIAHCNFLLFHLYAELC